jgi:hypothetical protein
MTVRLVASADIDGACARCGTACEFFAPDRDGAGLCRDCFGRIDGAFDGLVATPFAQITRERVEWLWAGRIPRRGVTIIAGDPGLGKSLLTVKLAADVSTGRLGSAPGNVLMISAEDSPSAVIRPRLEAAGADLARVDIVTFRRDGIEDGIRLPDDVEELDWQVARRDAALVSIDPLVAHLPENVNSWRDQSVRRALAPLGRMADKYECAVAPIVHLNKGRAADPLKRTGGSIGFTGAARSALILARDPDDPDPEDKRRVLAQFKSNYGAIAPSLRYEIKLDDVDGQPEAVLIERGECDHRADDLLAASVGNERTERDEAADLLRDELADGPEPQKAVQAAARAAGISEATLKRAKRIVGIGSKKEPGSTIGAWWWALPDQAMPWETDQPGSGEGNEGVTQVSPQ